MCGNYKGLANAIIERAVEDWKIAVQKIEQYKNPQNQSEKDILSHAKGRKKECENFFLGSWFALLTNLDGEILLENLNREHSERSNNESRR